MEKLGIFGGSFNPPHNGHIRLARQVIAHYALDKILIIPAFVPPHKDMKSSVSAQQRLAMCRLAFDFPDAEISDIEIQRGGKSYTYDTLIELKTRSDCDFFLVVGSDMLLTLDTWYRWRDILSLSHVIAASRFEGNPEMPALLKKAEELNNLYPGRVSVFEAAPFPISSTAIRKAVQNGEDIGAYVPDSIKQYIYVGGLYND